MTGPIKPLGCRVRSLRAGSRVRKRLIRLVATVIRILLRPGRRYVVPVSSVVSVSSAVSARVVFHFHSRAVAFGAVGSGSSVDGTWKPACWGHTLFRRAIAPRTPALGLGVRTNVVRSTEYSPYLGV